MLSRLIHTVAVSFLLTTAVFFLFSVFFFKNHDWDMDAFLYIGSRLWHGELFYLYDFETKLPPLQYLFSLPSALGGIGAWRLLTVVISSLLGFWSSHVFVRTLTVNDLRPFNFKQARLICFSFFLLLLYSLPGSESAQLEMTAASAAFISLALLLRASARKSRIELFYSGLFLAIAACIRPNYVYILPVTYIYLFLSTPNNLRFHGWCESLSFVKNYLPSVVMVNLGFLITILVLFLPYLFVEGGVKALIDGLNAIASYSDGVGTNKLFSQQFSGRTLTFYLGLYLASTMLFIYFLASTLKKYRVLSAYAFIAIVCILALNTSLLRNNYWHHNAIMFVPYAVPIFFLIFISLFKDGLVRGSQKIKVVTRTVSYVLFFIILAAPARQLLSYGFQVVKSRIEFNSAINERRIDHKLLSFLRWRNQSFLVIDSPTYHTLLDERRIGDGHPLMLWTVLSGKRLGPISNIDLYSEEVFSNPCLSLTRSGKEVIVFSDSYSFNTKLSECLDAEGSGYKKINVSDLEDYQIFIRP